MKKQIIAITAAAIALFTVITATAQNVNTDAPVPVAEKSALATAGEWVSTFFRDNTNFWDYQTARVSAMPIYSKGHAADVTTGDQDTFGVALSLAFPLDEKGQVSIGLFGAYFDSRFFMGSINTTLGKTVNVPVLNRPLFLWAEAGPAINLNHPDRLLAQAFTGGTLKFDLVKATPTRNPWTLLVGGGIGTVTDWEGNIFVGTLGLNHSFKGL